MSAIVSAFARVFKNGWYILLTSCVFVVIVFFAVWLSNFSLLYKILFSSPLHFYEKARFLLISFKLLNTNFTFISGISTIFIALLFGIQVSLVVFYIKQRIRVQKASGLGVMAMIVGFLGIGCASCGSVILSSIFGFGATLGILKILPLKGFEFSLISLMLLFISIFMTARKIEEPAACKNVK